MIVGKWNYEQREYDPYKLNDDWNTPMWSEDMREIVNCAQCGREIKFGDCYTSREIHNRFGLGFPVCESCYEAEWEREREVRR